MINGRFLASMGTILISTIFLLGLTGFHNAESVSEPKFEVIDARNFSELTQIATANFDGYPFAVEWSPDGKSIAIGVNDIIHILHGDTLEIIMTLSHPWLFVRELAYNRDGTLLASGGGGVNLDGRTPPDNFALLWDVQTSDLRFSIPHPLNEEFVTALAFSHDNSQLLSVTSAYDTIRYWDVKTGQLLSELTIEPPDDWVRILTSGFSHDASYFGIGDLDDELRVWQLEPEFEQLADVPQIGGELIFSRDETLLAAADLSGGIITIQNLINGEHVDTQWLNATDVFALIFSLHGDMLIQSTSDRFGEPIRLLFWNTASGELIGEMPLPESAPYLALSPDGTILFMASEEGIIRMFGVPIVE